MAPIGPDRDRRALDCAVFPVPAHGSAPQALLQILCRYPAVRRLAVCRTLPQIEALCSRRLCNVALVMPCPSNHGWRIELAEFIVGIRARHPRICFVLHATAQQLEELSGLDGRFKHYLLIENVDRDSELALRSCERWHSESYSFDAAVSFAGEDRDYARKLAGSLEQEGLRVYFDEFYEDHMLGQEIPEYLFSVYRNKARHCVPVLSKHYARKTWPTYERRAALDRALHEGGMSEYLLPVRLDNTSIPGITDTLGSVRDGPQPETAARRIARKLGLYGFERKDDIDLHALGIE